jgi:signal-transduction protein with cAMP-binding, CBS, and nucleotidyltransferase domain
MQDRTVLKSMIHRHVLSVAPSTTVQDAACAMTAANCGSILVVESGTVLVGILTERDLMTRILAKGLDAGTTPVGAVMTHGPICVEPETKVINALVIMIERGFRHLPVVIAKDHQILGVFSVRDAMPREIQSALNLTEFNEKVNDALG